MAQAPLEVGASGDAVVRLQSFLVQLGYQIPPSELGRKFFGPVTRQALLQFQKDNGLLTSGTVDAATAGKISTAAPPTNSVSAPRVQSAGASSTGESGAKTSPNAGANGAQSTNRSRGSSQPRNGKAGKAATPSPFTLVASPAPADDLTYFALTNANPTGTVSDNLTNGSAPVKSALSAKLSTALKNSLTTGLNQGGFTALPGLVQQINTVDIAANQNKTIQAFLTAQTAPMVAKEPASKESVDAEIAKIPGASTVGTLLQLNVPLKSNPVFQSDLSKASIASLLATSLMLGGNQKLQADFINAYTGANRSSQAYWTQLPSLNSEFTPAVVSELQLTMQLAAITGNNTALMSAVRTQYPVATIADLTKLTTADWEKVLNTPVNSTLISIPSSISGSTRDQQVANYVTSITTQLKKAVPTIYIGQAIAAQPQLDVNLVKTVLAANPGINPKKPLPASVKLSGVADPQAAKTAMAAYRQELNAFPGLDQATLLSSSSSPNPVRQHVSEVISNSPGLNIQTAKINTQSVPALQEVPEALQVPVMEQLKSIQRLSRLTTDYGQIFALQSAGLHSASAVARVPQASFLNTFAPALGSRATAQTVYSKAVNVNTQLVNVFMRVNDALNSPLPAVFGDVSGGTKQVLETIPNLTTLFGDQSSCQCQECMAMDGPAAYFVDLMNFLANSQPNQTTEQTPLDVLRGRRPDLWYIKLNCENTNTELPYIDLVNEILESYIVDGLLDWRTAKNTPADATTDQLTLNPEYTNPDAYQILQGQVYPAILPFDLPLETARTYLEALDTSRVKLMETFRHSNIPSELAVACEYLRISCATYSENCPAAPPLLPGFLKIPIAFDYRKGRLMFRGSMTATQQGQLLQLSQDSTYQQAIAALFQMGNAPSGGSYSVPLANLPPSGLLTAIPIPIKSSTANGGQLSFAGTMNWAQQAILLAISPDSDYQAAINSLCQLSQHAASGSYSVSFLEPVIPLIPQGIPLSFVKGQATFTGTMTPGQQAVLLNLSPDLSSNPRYISVITELFQMSSQAALGTFTCPWTNQNGISFTANPMIPISYSGGMLNIQGAMNPAQRVVLLSLSADAEFQAAVDNLFLMGSPSSVGAFTVPLNELPAGVSLPDQLASQIAYDVFNQRLTLTGMASNAEQATLATLNIVAPLPISPPATLSPSYVPTSVTEFLAIPLSYDAQGQQLVSQGSITPSQQSQLLSLSVDPSYSAAINALANAGGASTVTLQRLPAGVVMPDTLGTQFFQDPTTGRWTTSASLSRGAQDTLIAVSGGDSHFISLLTNLNRIIESSPIYDLDILVDATSLSTQQFYGVPTDKQYLPSMQPVESFLATTGIAYADLVSLLETVFLNPYQSITLNVATGPNTDQCDLSATSISGDNADLATFFQRAYRFIRLWKKMGWTITEVDLALSLLGEGDITPDVIVKLAQIKKTQQTLNLAVDQTLSFWANIDTSGRQSLYMRLFQNSAVANPVDQAFILSYRASTQLSSGLPQLSYEFPATLDTVTYSPSSDQITFAVAGTGTTSFTPDELAQLSAVLQPGWQSATSGGTFTGAVGSYSYHLPNPFSFPDSATNSIGFQETRLSLEPKLDFTGLMTDAEYAVLKALSTDSSYQLAIDNLYDLAWLDSVALVTSSTPTIKSHQQTILSALRISATDLAALLAGTMAIPDVLNLENLSALYRRATLAQGLGLAITDLLTLITLTGIDPFASPRNTLRFIELAQYVQSSNFSIQQLNYIYANTSNPTSGVAPLLSELFPLLQGLQAGLQQIVQADTFQPDPKGTRLKQTLASILSADLVSQATGLVNGTQVYSVPYAAGSSGLPPNVAAYLGVPLTFIPPSPPYNSEPGQLVLACNPTPSQIAALTSACADTSYQTALTSLLKMTSTAGTSQPYSTLLPSTAVPVPPGTTLPISPNDNPIVITYVAPTLTFSGSLTAPNTAMTGAQLTVLLSMSTDASFQTAVNTLFTNSQANGGPVNASLTTLPISQATLTSNPIPINWSAGLMTFGSSAIPVMTSAQQAVLLALSPDPSWRAAVTNLYSMSNSMSANGPTPLYSAPLNALPASLALPGDLPLMLSAPSAPSGTQLLQFTGPMTDADQSTLLALGSADAGFVSAIGNLYAQPRIFIAQTLVPALNGFLTVADAITNLIETPSFTAQDRGEYLLKAALADVQRTSSYNLITQTLGSALSLDVPTLSWLLLQVLPGFFNTSPGFSASYYAQQNQTGTAALTRTDPVINFQWGPQTPDSTLIPGPAFSADWTASIVVPSTDAFTFHIQCDTQSAVQLFVNGIQRIPPPLVPLRPAIAQPVEASGTGDYTSAPIPLQELEICKIELKYSYSGPGLGAPVPPEVVLTWSSPLMLETLVIPENTMMDDFMALASMGLSGTYYSLQNQVGTAALERTDAQVNFKWGSQTPDSSISGPAFSADWKGSVVVPVTDFYTFEIQADTASTVNLLLNGAPLPSNAPATAPLGSYISAPISLTQAQVCTLELQYSYPGSGALPIAAPPQISFNWSSPSMTETLISPPISVAVLDLQLLFRIASLLTTLNTKVADVQYLQENGTDFAGKDPSGNAAAVPFDLTKLPSQASAYTSPWFDQWKRLNALFALKASLPSGNVNIFKIFATASQQGVDFYKTLLPVIVTATGWNSDQVQYLYAEFGFSVPDFVDEQPLLVLQKCLALSSQVGVSCVKLYEWATILPQTSQAQDIKNAVKAKYDDATWFTVGTPLTNKLRDKQRNALMAYVLTLQAIKDANVTDADGLYEYFLIDVQMAPCMLTSRIVQATAAVQQFVQRCLMNLEEPSVAPCQIDADWWEWMKNYRVWQANREVFLYPENYLEPTLRDDMTPPFQDLMSALLQNPVTNDNVTQAYANYLNALNDVSQLEIVGMYWQQDTINEQAVGATGPDNTNTGAINTLHVFGRSAGTPNKYYYRQLSPFVEQAQENGPPPTWTPWEPVNLSISGNHLIPVVWNGRLFLFWPTFNESTDPNAQVVTAASSATPAPTIKQLQVSLNWSEYKQAARAGSQTSPKYKQGAWTGAQTTPDTAVLIPLEFNAYNAGDFDPSLVAFDSSQSSNSGPNGPGAVVISMDYPNAASPNVLADPEFTGSTFWNFNPPLGGNKFGIVSFEIPGAGHNCDTGIVNIEPGYDDPIPIWLIAQSEFHPAAPGQTWNASLWAADGFPSPLLTSDQTVFNDDTVKSLMKGQLAQLKISYRDSSGTELSDSPYTTIISGSSPLSKGSRQLPMQYIQGTLQGTTTSPAPQGTAWVCLQASFQTGGGDKTSGVFGSATFSDASLTLAMPPKLGQVQLAGFPGRISSDGWKSYSAPPGSATPHVPPFTTFDYMSLVGQGSLYFYDVILLHGNLSYRLMFPQEQLFSWNANNNYNYNTLPFFYADQQRTYFVTRQMSGDFPWLFQTHWHPFASAFLQAFNWGSVPALLTLANETLSKDGGVLFGLQLSYDQNSGTVSLSPGILVAQGQVFAYPETPSTNGPVQLSLPQNWSLGPNLYFTSADPSHFYWGASSNNDGDAFIGSMEGNSSSPIYPISNTNFQRTYAPDSFPYSFVVQPYPLENVDFSSTGAYSIYNWELFFHIPLLVATQLTTNQQFEDAMTWMEYIFNPTSSSTAPSPQRYWNFLPFAADTELGRIQDLLQVLATEKPQDRQIAAYQNDPFNPFAIARLRPMAFMKKTLMAYLDNLIAWADYLFGQNTRESINEATQIYVLADQILGPRPQTIPPREVTQDLTFNDINGKLDQTSNYWAQMENFFPFSSSGASGQTTTPSPGTAGSLPPGNFYFCIPGNSQLLGYWDTVADRLYKIRHCQNIAGQTEQLALFAPPINPALLVEATALGIDLDSVIGSLNAPSPNYRFTFMLQKAVELCSEVRSLGAALLSAMEKSDGEALSLLRASQETSLLQAVLTLKQSQINEANANYAGLQAAQAVASYRQSYYQNLITTGLSSFETAQLVALTAGQVLKTAGQVAQLLASVVSQVPEVGTGAAGLSSPIAVIFEGGGNISKGIAYGGEAANMAADILSYVATMCSIGGQWDRRSQEWTFQATSAGLELTQITQQMAAANFRIQIANTDYQNQQLQVTNSQAIQNFLTGKFTNQQLYSWMISQISGVYFQCYQMAYTMAQRAELCFRFELGWTTSNYIQFGYWDSLHKGLLAGEGLYADLKSMEMAYLDQNVREYEITKSISLVLLDPISLITLKETGICFISLPEALFDIDYPGHYMRRIKSLSLTIPCVAGPYTSINGTLTLVTNRIRWDSTAPGRASAYPENPPSDSRFIYDLTATQSIATSSAQNDSGMFEVNFRDERYLPFEGRGAISDWQLELPLGCNAFDFETITDVILNLKYTSRNGGTALRSAASSVQLPAAPAQTGTPSNTTVAKQTNLARFFSLKHEFPTEWYNFLSPAAGAPYQSMNLMLSMERFPYQYRGKKIKITSILVAFKFKDAYPPNMHLTSSPPNDFTGSGGQLQVGFNPPSLVAGLPSNGAAAPPPSLPLQWSSGYLNGTPYATWSNGPGGLGCWQFQLLASGLPPSLANGNALTPSVVDDIYIVCYYTAS